MLIVDFAARAVRVAFAGVWCNYWYVDSLLSPGRIFQPSLGQPSRTLSPHIHRLFHAIHGFEQQFFASGPFAVWLGQLHPGSYSTLDLLALLFVLVFLRLRHRILCWYPARMWAAGAGSVGSLLHYHYHWISSLSHSGFVQHSGLA